MIIARHIYKSFYQNVALEDVSFEIEKGEIVGFIGPNGAGKTTLMRILTTYLTASKGEAIVAGFDVAKSALDVRKHIGYLPETPALYIDMTVRDYLKYAANLKDIPPKNINAKIDAVLEKCHIRERQNSPIGSLSKGFRQRVGIAQEIGRAHV